jgi:hypothetical protein
MSMDSHGGMILTGESQRTWSKTCPSATLPTTNTTWIDPGAKSVFRGERQAANRLSNHTANNICCRLLKYVQKTVRIY